MTTKFKVVLLAVIMPFFMVACATDDTSSVGGELTLGTISLGNVLVNEVVPYTISLTAGTYAAGLITLSGNADLRVCEDVNCTTVIGTSAVAGLTLETVPISIFADSIVYIFVDGILDSNYSIAVDAP